MNTPASGPRRQCGLPGASAAGLGIGAIVLMALCCAGPALLGGGMLTALGTWPANPWTVGAGAAIVIAAVTFAVCRRSAPASGKLTNLTDRLDECGDTHVAGA